jgi:hypothetical protein
MKEMIYIPVDKLLNEYVTEAPIYYKGVNLRELYLIYAYRKITYHHKFDFLLKEYVRKIVSYFIRWKSKNSAKLLKEERNFSRSSGEIKYVFVCGFSRYNHVFSILSDIIEKIENKDTLLVVTDQRDVHQFYSERGVRSIHLTTSRFYIDPLIARKEKSKHAVSVMSRAELYMDYAEKLYDEFFPKVVMTSQDYWVFDQCFVHAAKKKNILTITHVHGVVQDRRLTLFEHVFSDKIVLWGENQRKIFKRVYNDDRMLVIGTSKFDHLLSYRNQRERNYITLAINSFDKKTNIDIISNVLHELSALPTDIKNKYTFILKLHATLNVNEWKKYMKVIMNGHSPDMAWDVRVNGNAEVLHQSKLLILVGLSTIALEAMICGVSVIELVHNEYDSRGLFKGIPDLLIPIDNLAKEVERRIEDDSYNSMILEKHKKYVLNEISSFNCSSKEIEIIDSLIRFR